MLNIQEHLVDETLIQTLYHSNQISYGLDEHAINSYHIFRSNVNSKQTAMARYTGDGIFKSLSNNGKININSIMPKDANQAAFMDSFLQKDILLSVGVGSAGTGKTTMALAYAAQEYLLNQKVIHLTKPTVMIGNSKAFGAVPGDIQEKYAPYLSSYYIVLEKIFGKNGSSYIEGMKKKNHIQYTPIALARGCTYENCTFIIDEAQNLDWHELNSIISRMGENTKCIILGDLNQVDTKTAKHRTGLYQLLHTDAFANSKIASAIELKTQYRSPITQLVADIHEELAKQYE